MLSHEESTILRKHREMAFAMPLESINPARIELFEAGVVQPYFERLRRDDPVHYTAHHEFGPYWSITKHADFLAVSADYAAFSSEGGVSIVSGGSIDGVFPMFMAMDPPDHAVRRRTVMPAFTGSAVDSLEHLIRKRAATILDSLPVGEEFDWMDRVAIELSSMTIATLFDFPQEHRRQVIHWLNCAISPIGANQLVKTHDEKVSVLTEFNNYFTTLWNRRVNAPPAGDLISLLAHGETTRAMGPKEFFGTIMLLIGAGQNTTQNAIGGSLLGLNLFPEEYKRLRADDSLVPEMISEAIRWQSPLAHARRTALVDTEIRGRKIRKGDKVILWFLSANHDEEIYPNPGNFEIGRKFSTIPTTFGHGIHRCVGNRLAEMQLRVLWEEILKRFPEIIVVEEPVRLPTTYIAGYRSMKTVIPTRKN